MAISGTLTRRTFLAFAAVGAMALSGLAAAAPVADRDYKVLGTAQPTDNPGKVEITEFFSYACPHCAELEPLFEAWIKRQPKDVVVRRVPVTFGREQWASLAKMYFTLDILGESDRMTLQVFNAIHKEDRNFSDEKAQFDWIASKGIDKKKYQDVYNSFSMAGKMQRANQMSAAYRVQGVPSVAVDGKFFTDVSMNGSFPAFFATLDALVAKARAEKGRK